MKEPKPAKKEILSFASRVATASNVLILKDADERRIMVKQIAEIGDLNFGDLQREIAQHRAQKKNNVRK